MKGIRLFFLLGIGFLIGNQSLFASGGLGGETKDKEKVKTQMHDAVESKQYEIEVDRALPMKGRSINLTSPYSLKVEKDSVFSALPYFGRAYSVPYGGGGGLNFEERTNDYRQSFDKMGNAKIHFRTRTKDDSYTFDMNVYTNGSVTINVSSVNKQGITYYGRILLKENP